jgi:hypothetical protein
MCAILVDAIQGVAVSINQYLGLKQKTGSIWFIRFSHPGKVLMP